MKINLSDVSETLLIPLWARAVESTNNNPIIQDNIASALIKKIYYDFSKFRNCRLSQVGCAIRARILDDIASEFILLNPESIIINLGCGLDTRFFRVDNGLIMWYDMDLLEAINLRKKYFSENNRYKMIAGSVLENTWSNNILKSDKPVLIIAEGIFMYFSQNEVKLIMKKLVSNFAGAEMLIEVTSKFIARFSSKHESVKKMKTPLIFKWGIKNINEIKELNSNIKVLDVYNYFNYYKKRWGLLGKLSFIPFIKNNMNNKIIRIKFDNT
jgi:O-methyltransferase involved in polyketide biosynthesis